MFSAIDYTIFHFINSTLHSSTLNKIMPYYRSMYLWIPAYAFLAAYLISNFGKKGLIFILCAGLSIGITDTLSSKVIKPAVQRLRPCQDDNMKTQVKLLVQCGSGYSFPSSHAANHFALVSFLIAAARIKNRFAVAALILWALSIGVAQIYVGLHYPSDVLAGSFLGFAVGNITGWLTGKYIVRDLKMTDEI